MFAHPLVLQIVHDRGPAFVRSRKLPSQFFLHMREFSLSLLDSDAPLHPSHA